MIHVDVTLRPGFAEVIMQGHAGYAEPGKDIVCAGASAMIQAAIAGLQQLAEQYPAHVQVTVDQRED